MTFALKDFQEETVQFGLKNPYTIYGLQQGLGKSLCAIETAVRNRSKTLIICPSYLKIKWKKEIEKFYPGSIVSLFDSDKQFYRLWDTDYCLISYYFAAKAEVLFEWADEVVFDEGHLLKNMDAQRTIASHRLVFENSIKRLRILTGTPIKNRVWEFYSLIALCNYDPRHKKTPEFLERFETYVDFANYFSHLREYTVVKNNKHIKIQKWEGSKNESELKDYLKNIFIRFRSEDVLDLPPHITIDVPVCYEDNPELLAEFENFQEGGSHAKIESSAKAKAALSKAPFTVEYVKDLIEQLEQVVVYTDHVDACEALALGLGVPAIHGEMSMKKRQDLADEFMEGKSMAIVATIGAFSTGVDLYSSSNLVFNDFPFVPGDVDQVIFRIKRIGQTRQCNIHRIIGSYQDEKIWEILYEKMKTIKEVLDD